MQKVTLLLALCILLIAAIVRFLPFPTEPQKSTVWDEAYFIPQTESYIVGQYFFDPHPPFARILFYYGTLLFNPHAKQYIDTAKLVDHKDGYASNLNTEGIRLFPKIFGSLVPVLLFLILVVSNRIIYRHDTEWNHGVAFVVALMAALENTFVLESRYALMTPVLVCMMLLSIYVSLLYYLARGAKVYLLLMGVGVAVGLAVGTKWLATSVLVLVLFLIVYKNLPILSVRTRISTIVGHALIVVTLATITYVGLFAWHFSRFTTYTPSAEEAGSAYAQDLQQGTHTVSLLSKIMTFHRLGKKYEKLVPVLDYAKPGENGSAWINWPIMARTIRYHYAGSSDMYGFIYLVGNPLVWFVGLVGVIGISSLLISRLLVGGQMVHPLIGGFALLYFANWLPFMHIRRVMYLYHYIPALTISLILVALLISGYILPRLGRTFSKGVFLVLLTGATLVCFLWYAPFTYRQTLTKQQFFQHILMNEWNMQWPK